MNLIDNNSIIVNKSCKEWFLEEPITNDTSEGGLCPP